MIETLLPNFCHRFEGLIWNTVASPVDHILLMEVRKPDEKRVLFSAFNYLNNAFLWRDRSLDEPWWINASALVDGVVVFTVYLDTNNPDKKGILAYNVENLDLLWWNNDFSISEISTAGVKGFSGKFGFRALTLDLHDGKEITGQTSESPVTIDVKRPVQYVEGMQYFETVKTFLANQLNLEAVSALEYLETDSSILISCYTNLSDNLLANYLLVFTKDGKLLLNEQLDYNVKGIGLDTFFIIDDFLFFIRNKSELVSFRIL